MTVDFKKIAAQAIAEGADQTVAKTGGGDSQPPAAGRCNLRLVGYIELGKHNRKGFNGAPDKVQDRVTLIFEVSGKNHPPIVTDSGTFPHRIEVTENLSLHEKARFFKLFRTLNYAGKAKLTAELLGEAYTGTIIHREYTGRDGKKHIAADLYDKELGAYTIKPPRVDVVDEDGEPTGEVRTVKVAEPLSPIRGFLWNYASKEQWDTLFIDGAYEERRNEAGEVIAPARSKNKYQLLISAAVNYPGSPIQKLLANGGTELELPADGVVDDEGADDEAPAAKPVARKPVTKSLPGRPAPGKGDPLAGIADE